ncbi:MAG: CRISPR-associated endonuclease Cas1 [Armatimonadetes bacterium]|nr:CRISPR-associated endonuclease Cas1 [Armatimonadota bacterium]
MQLVINTFGSSLRKEGETFLVQAGERKFQVSAHKVESILLTTGAHLSTDALQLANQHNIDVVFLDKFGDPYARVWQSKMGSTAAIRRRQLEIAETDEGLTIVREWTLKKLRNQLDFLDQLSRRRPEKEDVFTSPVATLVNCLARITELSGTIDERRSTLMGLEGTGGRAYFGCLSDLMPQEFHFEGRSRQPAKDEFNAMLNYAYGVLYSQVERACIIAGLDPFVGFLHTDNYNKKSLVFDMIEPFRILADRCVVLLFTGRKVRKEYFDDLPGGGMTLNQDGKAFLITDLNERLDQSVRYPVRGDSKKTRNIKQRHLLQYEAHALANRLLGHDKDMPRIVETEVEWAEDGTGEEAKG